MNKLNLSPTRMERTRQRDRLKTANRAHKLLKDKSDEMIRTFSQLIKQNKTLREHVEKDLVQALRLFLSASAYLSTQAIDDALKVSRHTLTLTCSSENIMGLVVPHVEIADNTMPQSTILLSTPANFDQAVTMLHQISAALIELANIEKTCSMLADEIEKVRRRINSLQYSMIPNIEETIKFITMKLDENQREAQVRALKVKEMQNQA